MRITALTSGVASSGSFMASGGVLTGPLTLHGSPTAPLHASTREYVDSAISNRALLNHTHTLANITDWPSVVTGSEVGHLDGVNSNIQTQLNDRLPLTGGALIGQLSLSNGPVDPLHIVTKQYTDNAFVNVNEVPVGAVVSLPETTTPVGYLRANGAAVSQATFSSLFTVVGHRFAEEVSTASTFTTNAALGAGAPWEQQFGFNNATGLGTFVSDGTLPSALASSFIAVTQNRVFLFNGTTIFTASVNFDGTLGAFTSVGTLPVNLHGSSVVVTRNRVFLLGGSTEAAAIDTIFGAVIQADGTLGAFTSVGTLPVNLHASSAIVTSSRVFLLGGGTGVAINTIHSAVIQADGTLGAFTAVGTLPTVLAHSSVLVTTSRVFLFGGYTHASNTANIFSALINTDGTLGAFTVTGSLPSVQNNTPVIATSSRVFLLGGWNGSAATNTIFSAPLIGGSGLNDYSRFYNGSINTFNGAPLSGAIVVYTNNPDRNTLFALPDETLVEALSPGMNRFIRAS